MQAALYAYLAGVMDSEGTIRITQEKLSRHPNWNPRYNGAVSMGMASKEIILLFQKTFTPNANIRIERVPNRKIIYRWGTSGSNIVPEILKKLLPYLIEKKKQAELVIMFCEGKKTKGFQRSNYLPKKEIRWREDLYQKVRKFNATGAAATK